MKTIVARFINRTSQEMRNNGQYSAAKTCLTVLHGLQRTAQDEDFTFEHLTPELLQEYQHSLLSKNCALNTVSLYMRTLQTICRKAEEEGITKIPKKLFDKVFMGYVPPVRRSVPAAVIRQLCELKLDGKKEKYAFARDLFLLSLYLRGINLIDLAHLRKSDLKDNVLTYLRSKTQKPIHVFVEPCAMKIIERYAEQNDDHSYLLPIIRKAGDREDERRQYDSALRLCNNHLKVISEILQLNVKLTSYVPRHTWANTAHNIGVDIADISEALCHSSEKMTKNYIRSFTPDRLASVNREIIACIHKGTESKIKEKKPKNQREFKAMIRSGSL